MELFAGYRLCADSRFTDTLIEHRDRVKEIYFSWPGIANGRSTSGSKLDIAPWEAQQRQLAELGRLSRAGMRMNLLLNGNCYGSEALSRSFYRKIGDLIDNIGSDVGLHAVTTASPVVARFVKMNFPSLELRASVNMEIGTREGVEYLADVMDGFYIKREMNRHLEDVRAFADMCHEMGKKAYILANSGCLNYCSARTFHDNLVSHETEVMKMDNAFDFHGLCREFLSKPENRRRILEISNWIRPQDLQRYDGIVDGAKLATRVSERPEMIVAAYASGRFSGNLLELTEPDLSAVFRPAILGASGMPEEYFEKVSACGRNCATCEYCKKVYDRASEILKDDILI